MQALGRIRTKAARLRERMADRPEAALLEEALQLADALRIECAGLQHRCVELKEQLQRNAEASRELVDTLPCAVIVTDGAGQIVDANRAATTLFAVSRLKMNHALLMHFAEDRPAFADLIRQLPYQGQTLRASARFRPRDRAPFDADVTVVPDAREGGGNWLWLIERVSVSQIAGRTPIPPALAALSSAPSAS